MDLHGRHHFPRNYGAVDGALGQGIGNAWQWHAHRNGAQGAHQLGHLACGRAHFQTLHVCNILDGFVSSVNHAWAVNLQGDNLCFFELIGCHGLHVFPICLRGSLCVGHHERQLKHFNTWEATCGVPWQRPNDVNDAIACLVVQLNGRTAQLHGGVGFKFNAAARFFFNLVHPRFVHVEPHIGLWRHEGVKFQRDGLLCKTSQCRRCNSSCCA